MNILTKNRSRNNQDNALSSAVRQARAKALQQDVTQRGIVSLSTDTYKRFAFDGWSRADVETAVNDCVANGAIVIESDGAYLWLRLTKTKIEVTQ